MPVVTVLDELDEKALVRILSEPKNSIVRQYAKFFDMEGVELEFTSGALDAVAKTAISKGLGARGLRSVMESVMLDLMYEIPERENISKCLIDEECIIGKGSPVFVFGKNDEETA